MSTCGGTTAAVYEYVQASAESADEYVLSAPLVPSDPPGNSTLCTCTTLDPSTPGFTKKLMLFGASSFHIRVDASLVAYGEVSDVYVSVGIGLVDEIIDTLYSTPSSLPASTLRFNFGITEHSTSVGYASTSTFVTAVVPPGVYYVSSTGTFGGSVNEVIGTLVIEATPIVANGAQSTAQNPAIASSAWGNICWNC